LKNAEQLRLDDAREHGIPWRKWGPYLSERQWGTVREDYSDNGNAWDYFSHDQSRSRTYRWGEDGIAGISDEKQRLCFALALWNGADPILKERLFGLTNAEGNHGEDVKEYYFYLDSTPTHSYMKYLYKYPHKAYPYGDLVETNKRRTRNEPEYELIDTGVFDQDRYFDVSVEYAKEGPEDLLIRVSVANRGPEPASLHLLPTLWFRNTWTWNPGSPKPSLRPVKVKAGVSAVAVSHADLGERFLYCEGEIPLLFTENETNNQRVFKTPNAGAFVKDGINNCVVHGAIQEVNCYGGTKVSAHYFIVVESGRTQVVRLRLTNVRPETGTATVSEPDYGATFHVRQVEADQFYDSLAPASLSPDERLVMRQALAGMLWSKQYYYFDLDWWLHEHGCNSALGVRSLTRNSQWFHMVNDDIISMPDKWEDPWYAAWDLAFHTVALSGVDIDFAKDQLNLMLQEVYLHPNGQIPAYEWNFGDVNPPVHAWACLFLYRFEQALRGQGDRNFLENILRKLLLNFTWWVNRKDAAGNNIFEGGFLGLDNIGVFDRSAPLPTGGYLEQADGTAWMAMYCQNMLDIAIELASYDPNYATLANKFLEHFLWIAGAMDRVGCNQDELWDEEDGFFYDVLCLPNGSAQRLKVRSLVGLLPLCATAIIPASFLERVPAFMGRMDEFLRRRPGLVANLPSPQQPGIQGRRLLAILNETKLRRILTQMLDPQRFLSPYGIRSLSKWHEEHPYVFDVHGEQYKVEYMPAESTNGLFGGNSNWRGPIWFPVNLLIIRSLLTFYEYYGDEFTIECPTGSGIQMTLFEVARDLSSRLSSIFLKDQRGRRPVFGGCERFQTDPHWQDYVLFHEYFHADNGAGIGASHQTGWTGTIALLLQLFGKARKEDFLGSDEIQILRGDTAASRQ